MRAHGAHLCVCVRRALPTFLHSLKDVLDTLTCWYGDAGSAGQGTEAELRQLAHIYQPVLWAPDKAVLAERSWGLFSADNPGVERTEAASKEAAAAKNTAALRVRPRPHARCCLGTAVLQVATVLWFARPLCHRPWPEGSCAGCCPGGCTRGSPQHAGAACRCHARDLFNAACPCGLPCFMVRAVRSLSPKAW